MVFSYFIYKLPYSFAWYVSGLLKFRKNLIFYCGDPIDYYIFEPVKKHLGIVPYATDKKVVKSFLKEKGIEYLCMPVFPNVVIMARHSTYKFPCRKIIRIGLRHGAYHFKRMISAYNYNQFDLYLMTSKKDVAIGEKLGIKSACATGFPKLDPAFDGSINHLVINEIKKRLKLNDNKHTVLFTSTYDNSGMSAVASWYDKLEILTEPWNVLVTLHPWVNKEYREKIKSTPGVHYIADYNILPYIMLSDAVVGDNSSILAECCALDKPIITFKLPSAKRSLDEIDMIINSISYRINDFTELPDCLNYAADNPDELSDARKIANQIFFDKLDGQAGQRAAEAIRNLVKKRNNLYELD